MTEDGEKQIERAAGRGHRRGWGQARRARFGVRCAAVALVFAAALAAAGMIATSQALATGDVNQAECPNSALKGFSAALPDCRAYEMVSPAYTESEPDGERGAIAVGADGESVAIDNYGVFAEEGLNTQLQGAPYRLTRGTDGWEALPLGPPASQFGAEEFHSALEKVSALGSGSAAATSLWGFPPLDDPRTEGVGVLERRESDGSFMEVGPLAYLAQSQAPEVETRYGTVVGATRDLEDVVVSATGSLSDLPSELWPGDTSVEDHDTNSLYEYQGVALHPYVPGAAEREPELVAVTNAGRLKGSPHVNEDAQLISQCGAELGYRKLHLYNSVAEDAAGQSLVFFTVKEGGCEENPVGPATEANATPGYGEGPAVEELWARVGGEASVDISEPALSAGECSEGEPCEGATPAPAEFQGASEDGEWVFFTSEQPLVDGAPAAGKKLYAARLAVQTNTGQTEASVAELRDVSLNPSTSAQNPALVGVAGIAESGQHVYFVAEAALSGANARGESPVEGSDNLYVYEPGSADPAPALVATTLGPAEKAAVEAPFNQRKSEKKAECNAILSREEKRFEEEGGEEPEEEAEETAVYKNCRTEERAITAEEYGELEALANPEEDRVTPDGTHLVFASIANLTGVGVTATPQLFEYSLEEQTIARVSSSPARGAEYPAELPPSKTKTVSPTNPISGLAISYDGSYVTFSSRAALTPAAAVGSENVYEYHEGHVYLISDGQDTSAPERAAAETTGGAELLGMDPSGANIFFTTVSQLAPQQAQNQRAVYDARIDGGFAPASEAHPCAGEECQGPPGSALPTPTPLSSTHPGGENLPPAEHGKATVTTVRLSVLRQAVRRFDAFLVVKVSAVGELLVKGRGVSKVSKKAGKAGQVRVEVHLDKRFHMILEDRRRKKVKVRLLLRFEPKQGKAVEKRVHLRFTSAVTPRHGHGHDRRRGK